MLALLAVTIALGPVAGAGAASTGDAVPPPTASETSDAVAPGDGLGLAPTPSPPPRPSPSLPAIGGTDSKTETSVPPPSYDLDRPAEAAPRSPTDGTGWPGQFGAPAASAILILTSAIAAAASTVARRRQGPTAAAMPDDVLVVFVSGHASESPRTFAPMVRMLGLRPDQVRYFDWRLADIRAGERDASDQGSVHEAVAALRAQLEYMSDEGRSIYLVGHSKGGATLAELIADWDDHPQLVPPGIVGAALLDPPLASGWQDVAQSAAYHARRVPAFISPLVHLAGRMFPDDGGYSPHGRSYQVWEDRRAHLGERAGIETMVIRNPDSWLTSFADDPDGLRVYDLEDGGHHPLRYLDPIRRLTEAHNSVLVAPGVAACIGAELRRVGSCSWDHATGPHQTRRPPGKGGGGRAGSVL
jgi:hypothetical protein